MCKGRSDLNVKQTKARPTTENQLIQLILVLMFCIIPCVYLFTFIVRNRIASQFISLKSKCFFLSVSCIRCSSVLLHQYHILFSMHFNFPYGLIALFLQITHTVQIRASFWSRLRFKAPSDVNNLPENIVSPVFSYLIMFHTLILKHITSVLLIASSLIIILMTLFYLF